MHNKRVIMLLTLCFRADTASPKVSFFAMQSKSILSWICDFPHNRPVCDTVSHTKATFKWLETETDAQLLPTHPPPRTAVRAPRSSHWRRVFALGTSKLPLPLLTARPTLPRKPVSRSLTWLTRG